MDPEFDATQRLLQTFTEVFALLFGLCVGSFLNVVIARLPAEQSVVKPRSRCPKCGNTIAWYDNLPVLSWLLLRGKCRHCGLPISPRYPAVELLVGLLAYALAKRYGVDPRTFTYLVFTCLLVAIAYIDLDYWFIPDELSMPGILTGLLASLINPELTLFDSLVGALGGFLLFALVGFVGAKVFKKEALGQGDWWLLAMIGAYLGWKALLPVILLSSLQGAVIGGLLIVLGRNRGTAEVPAELKAKLEAEAKEAGEEVDDWQPDATAIPFGPFLVLGALEQLFLGDWLLGLYDALMQKLIL